MDDSKIDIPIIINPISGTLSAKKKQQIADLFRADLVFFTQHKGHAYQLAQQLGAQHGRIFVAGGDGTLNEVINALHHTQTAIGIIPLGSGNGLATDLKISKNILKAIQNAIKGTPKSLDLITINNHYMCNVSGLGFDANVALAFDQRLKTGALGYTSIVFQHIFKTKTYDFTLHTSETNIKLKAYWIAIANSRQYGNGLIISPTSRLNDGVLEVVAIEKQWIFIIFIKMFMQILFSSTFKTKLLFKTYKTQKVEIENTTLANLHIDGEVAEKYKSTKYLCEIKPQAIRIIC